MTGRGSLVTVEGVDGSGKSTQTRLLAEALRETGRKVLTTREPGGSPGAEEIRRLLIEGPPERWSPETELLLFTAARRDHVERAIRPALDRGEIVLCDRFVDSTRAYQGEGPLRARVDSLHRSMIGLDPHLTLILDIDPEDARARAGADRFERRGLGFQRRLRGAFRGIAEAEPDRCRLIDADGPVDEVAARLLAAATAWLDG